MDGINNATRVVSQKNFTSNCFNFLEQNNKYYQPPASLGLGLASPEILDPGIDRAAPDWFYEHCGTIGDLGHSAPTLTVSTYKMLNVTWFILL